MRNYDLPLLAGFKNYAELQRIEHLQLQNVNISRDGNTVQFDMLMSTEKRIANIPLPEIDALISQLQHAAKEMRNKQRLHNSGGFNQMRELFDSALEPVRSDVFIDPRGDVVFLHKFDSHGPIAIKTTPAYIKILRAKTNAALARLAN